MNILYHHRTQGTGAEGVHIAYIVKGFRELKFNVDVVSPNNREPSETAGGNPYGEKKGTKARLFNFLSRHLPQMLFEMMELGYNFSAAEKLSKHIREKQVKFIYERYAFFMYAGARLAKRYKIPYIVEVNEVAGEERVRKQFFVNWAQQIERQVFDQADAIIVVSGFLKEKIKELGVKGDKIHVLPNAVDEKLFDPIFIRSDLRKKFNVSPNSVVIGFIGWFVAWHNLEGFVKTFSEVAKLHDTALFLVGDGVLKENLKALAKESGIEGKVFFPGAVPYQQIPDYVSMMDICVIPGSNEYRSPIKLFEYMAMEKAVVAPRLKPIEDIVEEKVDGILFDQDDQDSLKEALLKLVKEAPDRHTLGINARKKILTKHTWLKNAQKIVGLVN